MEEDMKYGNWMVLGLCVLAVVSLMVKVSTLGDQIQQLSENNRREIAGLQDALKSNQAGLAVVNASAPGLGDYMTTVQLHTGKLWFAAEASNWDLARYELAELKETLEAAETLNAEKNGVKISSVLDSFLKTQIAHLEEAINNKGSSGFQKSYDEILATCNECHTEAGFKFIRVVRPAAPPVSNQRWDSQSN